MVRGLKTHAIHSSAEERNSYYHPRSRRDFNNPESRSREASDYFFKDNASMSTNYSAQEKAYGRFQKKIDIPFRSDRKRASCGYADYNQPYPKRKLFVSERDIPTVHIVETKTTPRKRSQSFIESTIDTLSYFQTCLAFENEGICMKGADCCYTHAESNRKYGKVAEKFMQLLEKATIADSAKKIEEILQETEKFEKYLPVFKNICYRYDKNDLFPAF